MTALKGASAEKMTSQNGANVYSEGSHSPLRRLSDASEEGETRRRTEVSGLAAGGGGGGAAG